MTTWEIRRCDLCGEKTGVLGTQPLELERAGWRRDDQGRDVCPSCAWTHFVEDEAA